MNRLTVRAFHTALLATALLLLGTQAAHAAPPSVFGLTFTPTDTSVTFEADINPNGKATSYRFEWGTADCSANPCASLPAPPAKEPQISNGVVPVHVFQTATGLTPGAVYHFRLIAKNTDGTLTTPDRAFRTHLPPPVFGPCPNDLFRLENPSALTIEHSSANLPDCRSYEQVSPADKNGGDAVGVYPFLAASPDGTRATFMSVSGVPGGEGSQDVPTYLASRGSDGWSSRGLLPPAATAEAGRLIGWSEDLTWTYTEARRFDPDQSALFTTHSPDGSRELIVDFTPRAEFFFAGSLSDGSLLFESKATLIAGAKVGKSNVYLWDRPSDEIHLVSTTNQGAAPKEGALAGPYDWAQGTNAATLTQGGGEREYYTQDSHVLSADGSTAFFTEAATGQLFTRTNPTEEQSDLDLNGNCAEPAEACTVHVSDSQRTIGLEPGGSERGGPRPAAFQAASADGRYVFFTSPEMLTDDANTGPEPTELPPPPTIGRSNLEGKEVDKDFLTATANGLAVDAAYIYWLDSEAGAIGRAELGGANPEPAFVTGLPSGVEDLAVDEEYLYWVDPAAGHVGRARVDGSGAPELDFISGAREPRGVAVDDTYIYWTNAQPDPGDPEGHRTIGRANLDGTNGDQKFISLEVAGAFALVPDRLAVGEGHIYVTAIGDGKAISRFTLAGVKDDEFGGSQLERQRDVTVESEFVFWSAEGTKVEGFPGLYDGAIRRADLGLTEKIGFPGNAVVYGSNVEQPKSLAASSTQIYWANNPPQLTKPGRDLYRYDTQTGEIDDLTPLPTGDGAQVSAILGASEDGSRVYFAARAVLAPGAGIFSCEFRGCFFNLYLWENGTIRFIARLLGGPDRANWFASIWEGGQRQSQITPDGKTLVFSSTPDQTAYESNGIPQYYRYDADTDDLACITCNPTGKPPLPGQEEGAFITLPSLPQLEPDFPEPFLPHNLTRDGNRFFFNTTDPLVATDVNATAGCPLIGKKGPRCADVYEWEAAGTGSCEPAAAIADGGCLYLLSSGKGGETSRFASASADGDHVFIFSRERLVGQDTDDLIDLYDVGVGAGLTSQNPAPPPAPCLLEACKPAPTPPPAPESPATPSFSGPSDPQPKRKCAKRRRSKKHRAKKCANRRGAGSKRHHGDRRTESHRGGTR